MSASVTVVLVVVAACASGVVYSTSHFSSATSQKGMMVVIKLFIGLYLFFLCWLLFTFEGPLLSFEKLLLIFCLIFFVTSFASAILGARRIMKKIRLGESLTTEEYCMVFPGACKYCYSLEFEEFAVEKPVRHGGMPWETGWSGVDLSYGPERYTEILVRCVRCKKIRDHKSPYQGLRKTNGALRARPDWTFPSILDIQITPPSRR